jgi:phosphoglycolate phosphatase-like HAD superfamily hydrolase
LVVKTRLYDGIEDVLRRLSTDGFVLALATNKPSAFTARIFESLGLDRLGIRGVASADEAAPKPDPASIVLALERAGLSPAPERTLYVGDMPVDAEAARRFGCPIAGAGWGFSPEALRESGPDHWLDSPLELAPLAVRLREELREEEGGQRKQ